MSAARTGFSVGNWPGRGCHVLEVWLRGLSQPADTPLLGPPPSQAERRISDVAWYMNVPELLHGGGTCGNCTNSGLGFARNWSQFERPQQRRPS